MRFGPESDGFDRRRATALGVVLVLHLLLVLLLVTLAPPRPSKPPGESKMIAFNVLPDKPVATPKPASKPKRTAGAKPKSTPAPKVTPTPQDKLFEVQLFEGIDIRKLPNHRAELAGTGDASAGAGADSDTDYGPGAGPGGERLYNAEWQREPTNAELSYYITHGAPPGSWALIACKTIERYQVEDCRELADSPPGSGLARAMVNAAWQFRVKPPRVGGKVLVGAWVRIRISFSEKPEP